MNGISNTRKEREMNVTKREVLADIRETGCCHNSPAQGSYGIAIIRCSGSGFALIGLCNPYGGDMHFAIDSGSGRWHTRGLDDDQAREYLPRNGSSLKSILRQI